MGFYNSYYNKLGLDFNNSNSNSRPSLGFCSSSRLTLGSCYSSSSSWPNDNSSFIIMMIVLLNNLLLQVIMGRVLEMRNRGQTMHLCKVPRFSNRMLALVVADYSFLCDSKNVHIYLCLQGLKWVLNLMS